MGLEHSIDALSRDSRDLGLTCMTQHQVSVGASQQLSMSCSMREFMRSDSPMADGKCYSKIKEISKLPIGMFFIVVTFDVSKA